jgi:hypothetical protein
MKKTLSIILAACLVLVLAVTLFPATTAFAKEATELVLVDVRFSFANGLVLTFAANGKIDGYNLPSSVLINGKMVKMDCVVKNDQRTVVCHTTKDLGFAAGDSGSVTVFGQTMTFSAPKVLQNEPESEQSVVGICPEGMFANYLVTFHYPGGSPGEAINNFHITPGQDLDTLIQNYFAAIKTKSGKDVILDSVTFTGCYAIIID